MYTIKMLFILKGTTLVCQSETLTKTIALKASCLYIDVKDVGFQKKFDFKVYIKSSLFAK